MIDGKTVVLGIVAGLFLSIIIGILIPLVGVGLGIILAGFIVGLLVKSEPGDGFANGALTGCITALILGLIPLLGVTLIGSLFGVGLFTGTIGLIFLALFIILGAVLGAVGGTVGSLVTADSKDKTKIGQNKKDLKEPLDITPTSHAPLIDFTIDNLLKCQCTNCPVQEKSKCSSEKLLKIQEKMESENIKIKAQDVPGMHCATGNAVCKDLDFEEKCLCVNCPLWEEYNLENNIPLGFFCKEGKSH